MPDTAEQLPEELGIELHIPLHPSVAAVQRRTGGGLPDESTSSSQLPDELYDPAAVLITTLSDIPEDDETQTVAGAKTPLRLPSLESLDNFDDVINHAAADLGIEGSRVFVDTMRLSGLSGLSEEDAAALRASSMRSGSLRSSSRSLSGVTRKL